MDEKYLEKKSALEDIKEEEESFFEKRDGKKPEEKGAARFEGGMPEKKKEEATITISHESLWKILAAVFAVLLVVSIFTYGFRGAGTTGITGTTVKDVKNAAADEGRAAGTGVSADDDPQKGPANAKVTIIEFSDFQCPFCARAQPTLEQIFQTYGSKVRLVYRDFPLSFHQNAQKAAEAAECADEQGKFWEYHDILFANQNALDTESLKKYAAELKLDSQKFNSCLDSGKYGQEVKKDFSDGQSAGVQGTPAFFINGRLVSGAQPFENFKAIIDEELK